MSLEEKLQTGDAVFGVVGLGYVGLPLMVEMGKAGNTVVGFDISQEKIDEVNAGRSYIPDVPSDELSPLIDAQRIKATTDFGMAAQCDCIAICVPTPLNRMKEPDISFMVRATEAIAPHITPGTLVTLESTTYPGTTDEIIKPILEAQGLTVGEDVFLAFSPERVDPGNRSFQTKNTPKVVGGHTAACTDLAVMFYESFLDSIVPVTSTKTAEMTKLFENIFRCVNIALVNELLQLCDRMEIDMWEVVDAAKTKPFGFMPFYPGPGLGGHCIPIDPFYLSWKAREFDFRTKFIELAGETNEDMPYWVVERLTEALNTQGKALNGAGILILGVAYKSDIDDIRESPAIKVIDLIVEKGGRVSYHDPYVPRYTEHGTELSSVELSAGAVAGADAVLVLTGHSGVDYGLVSDNASLVLDTRNAMREHGGPHIVKL